MLLGGPVFTMLAGVGGVQSWQRRREIPAWRDHEDEGGERNVGRKLWMPRADGVNFSLKRLLCVNFRLLRILLSISQVKVKSDFAALF